MARYGRDYDREDNYYGNRGWLSGGYGRGYGTRAGWGREDRDRDSSGYRGTRGYGDTWDNDYDRDYQSRARTNYGDPYGDRTRGTPIRMIRGEFENPDRARAYDRDYYGRDRDYNRDYDRDYYGGRGYRNTYDYDRERW